MDIKYIAAAVAGVHTHGYFVRLTPLTVSAIPLTVRFTPQAGRKDLCTVESARVVCTNIRNYLSSREFINCSALPLQDRTWPG